MRLTKNAKPRGCVHFSSSPLNTVGETCGLPKKKDFCQRNGRFVNRPYGKTRRNSARIAIFCSRIFQCKIKKRARAKGVMILLFDTVVRKHFLYFTSLYTFMSYIFRNYNKIEIRALHFCDFLFAHPADCKFRHGFFADFHFYTFPFYVNYRVFF